MARPSTSPVALLSFRGLQENVSLTATAGTRPLSGMNSRINSRVITMLGQLDQWLPGEANTEVTMPEAITTPWVPEFWTHEDAISECVGIFAESIPDPVFWVIGEYERSELDVLEQEGLIPRALVYDPNPNPRVKCHTFLFPVIVRVSDPKEWMMPVQQGNGHFCGTRLAVFRRGYEPTSLYQQWIGAMKRREIGAIRGVLCSDINPPAGTVAWLAPFGGEDRQHAIIAHSLMDVEQIVVAISQRLQVPVVEWNCLPDAFDKWQLFYVMPEEIERCISTKSRGSQNR